MLGHLHTQCWLKIWHVFFKVFKAINDFKYIFADHITLCKAFDNICQGIWAQMLMPYINQSAIIHHSSGLFDMDTYSRCTYTLGSVSQYQITTIVQMSGCQAGNPGPTCLAGWYCKCHLNYGATNMTVNSGCTFAARENGFILWQRKLYVQLKQTWINELNIPALCIHTRNM